MVNRELESIIEQFTALRSAWPADVMMQQMRADLDSFYARFEMSEKPDVESLSVGEAEAEMVSVGNPVPDRVVLYFHGGGFAVGSPPAFRNFAAAVSGAARCRVLVSGYRLAPEHRYPTQLEDARAAFAWLRDRGISGGDIALLGDSAGAALCVSLMLALREAGDELPACAVLLCPWLDLECQGDSYDRNADVDPVSNREIAKMMAEQYVGDANRLRDPLANVALASLEGLPPILVHAAGRDVFLDDARRIAERASKAGVDTALSEWPEMIHQWHLYASALEPAREAIADLGRFLETHLGSMRANISPGS